MTHQTPQPLLINVAVKGLFEKKVERTNRKARKLGMPPVTFTYGETHEKVVGRDTMGSYITTDERGRRIRVALYIEVFLHGEAPVIEGYEFIATVDLRGSSPMIKRQPFTAPDVDLRDFFENDGHCDHCGWNRNRKDVLILREQETGNLIQIGRSCAADFFRSKEAAAMVAVSDWIEAYGNVSENSPRAEPMTSVERMFQVAAAVVRTFGWVHHRDLDEDNTLRSTRSRVWQNLFPNPQIRAKYPDDYVVVEKQDEEEAQIVMEWLHRRFLDKPVEDCSEFERNVKAAVEYLGENKTPFVRDKNLNYLIWGIAGYKRDLQREAEERRRKKEQAKLAAQSGYVGSVGERREFTATLEFKRGFGTQYGVKYVLKLRDDEGNVIVWWGTNDTAARMVVGNRYTIKARIKKHDTYNGVKETTVSHAKLIEGELGELA